MSRLNDDIAERIPRYSAVYAQFSRPVSDLQDPAYVIIPAFDMKLEIGPCRWQSRDLTSLPVKGDDALVVFDNYQKPWIVAWWPFD